MEYHTFGYMEARELQSKGGKARAKKMTPAQRKASAKKAAQARWNGRERK
jgi:hypothetical protein